MSTFTRKKLAFTQLAASKSDIYQPTSAIGLVHNIILHNTNTSAEQIVLYMHDGTSEYMLFNFSLPPNDSVILSFGNEGLIVDSSSKITGYTTTASCVTISISGQEETS